MGKCGHCDQTETPTERGLWDTEAEVGVVRPQAKESWELPGAGRAEEVLPCRLWKERGPADILLLGFWPQELCKDEYCCVKHPARKQYREAFKHVSATQWPLNSRRPTTAPGALVSCLPPSSIPTHSPRCLPPRGQPPPWPST